MSQLIQTATLGGGCFWCTEAVFLEVAGVLAVEPGYAGGQTREPTYEQICEGNTGHAEVVKIEFEASRITFKEILEIFFAIHDPTTLNRQGHDVGTQYRSVIFTHSDEQRAIAVEVIAQLEREGLYDSKIVTQLVPLDGNYWPAEAYHRNYFAMHPTQGYCSAVVGPKVAKFRKTFAHRFQK